jgi:hypothetical protein
MKMTDHPRAAGGVPRGIRNNNPGNIRYDGTKLVGLADPPTDGAFCIFSAAKYGIRAMARIISNYNGTRGLNTVRKIISRWAPPNENDTAAYVASVAAAIGRGADTPLDLAADMPLLCRAIIRHENGACPYGDDEIRAGIGLCSEK